MNKINRKVKCHSEGVKRPKNLSCKGGRDSSPSAQNDVVSKGIYFHTKREPIDSGKGESGQATLTVVLTLLVLGAVIITPILLFMDTGLKVTQTHEARAQEFYSADAGVEDALWKIRNDVLPDWMQGIWNETSYNSTYTYSIGNQTNPEINYKGVTVTIQPVWALEGLENQTAQRRTSNDTLVTLGSVIDAGKYEINLARSDQFTGNLTVLRIGCWLPVGFQYVTNSSNLENSTQNYYCVPRTFAFRGGTAIEWDTWLRQTNTTIINFNNLTGPSANNKIITFRFTPTTTPDAIFSWVKAKYNNDPFLSWDVDCKIYKITSTATDPVTGKLTTVTAYTSKSEFRKVGSSIEGDYQPTGNALMRVDDNAYFRELLYQESPAQMSGIPAGASVSKILLYWSGWEYTPRDVSSYNQSQLLNLVSTYKVNQVRLKVKVGTSVFNRTITADSSQVLPNKGPSGGANGWAYSCCADVTNLVRGFFGGSFTGSANYTVGHVLLGPARTTNALNGVWGSSATDVFVVGASGTIFHYDGTSWSTMNSGTSNTLYGVWGSDSSHVYAVGASGTIRYYNGTAWSPMTSGITNDLNGVWGSDSSHVFAVGSSGTIRYYNGSSWSGMTSGISNTLRGVWGSDSSHVFAVGSSGTIRYYNGTAWSRMESGISRDLNGVWGSSATNVYAVGDSAFLSTATIRHYDGSSWSGMTSGTSNDLYGVWGSDSSHVYAVGSSGTIRYYNGSGSSWSGMTSDPSNTLRGVWGSSATNVYAVGASGTMLHYDGSAWSSLVGTYNLRNWNDSHSGETVVSTTNFPLGTPAPGHSDDNYQWAYSAWSVVVIYTSPQTSGHQLYLYDTFRYVDLGQTLVFNITNFLAPPDVVSDPQAARITCFVGEGDNVYVGDTLSLNGYLLPRVDDGVNPQNNVWNSKSNVLPNQANDGVDIDTFSAGYPIIKPGDSQATVRMVSGEEIYNLVYMFLSLRSETKSGGILTYLYG